jgi:AbiV family abortive infection protein
LEESQMLYKAGRYSTSFALAVLSREEIGRSSIYLRKRMLVLGGQTVTLKSLRRETTDHIRKVSVAQEIIGVPVSIDWNFPPPEPGSPEEDDLIARFAQKRIILEERLPQEAHERKLRALYVDPAEDAPYWHCPHTDIHDSEADLMITTAVCEYDISRGRLLHPRDPEHQLLIDHWHTRPALPAIEWDFPP